MVPNCHEEYRMQPLQLSHLARMMRMIETHDDVTMAVVIVIVIEVIREVVEVVDMSISTKIKVRPVSPVFTHLTCNCGGADINSTYRQCLVSMRNSTTYFTRVHLPHLSIGRYNMGVAATWGNSSRNN